MAPQPITLTEGQPPQLIDLSTAEFDALDQLAIVEIARTSVTGRYAIGASRKVGALNVGGREIVVRPKIKDLGRLIFLVGYARDVEFWHDEAVHLEEHSDLLPALADAFSRITVRALEQGLLMGYRTMTDSLPVLRGRILAGEQMTHHFGMPLPLAVEFDDFTTDIAENRLLLMAAVRLLSVPRISDGARRQLHRLRLSLADVTLLPGGSNPPGWHSTRLNSRYHSALRLAEVVLSAQSFEQHLGGLAVSGFMFDMWKIFEDFTCTAINEALQPLGGVCVMQFRGHLDVAAKVSIRPDLVWLSGNQLPLAVIDAKYKAERPFGFPDADLYQMLAYCTALDLANGHLVYAHGLGKVRTHTVRNNKVQIHCHTLDLAQEPSELLAQIGILAMRIADSAAVGSNPPPSFRTA